MQYFRKLYALRIDFFKAANQVRFDVKVFEDLKVLVDWHLGKTHAFAQLSVEESYGIAESSQHVSRLVSRHCADGIDVRGCVDEVFVEEFLV